MGEEDEDAEDGEDGSKQGSDGNKTPVGEGGNGDIAAVEKSAEVTGEKNRKNEKTRTRAARVNQGHEVIEGDDQGEGGPVEETEEDAEPGVTASSKAVLEVEAQTANGTTTPDVESETAEQKGSADGEGHGEVGQAEGRDASQSGMSASELVKQAVDAAGSASISPDAETGNLEPASTQTDINPQLPNDPSQSAELKHDVEDPQAGSSQSQHASGDGIQDNGENAPPAEQGTTSSLPPAIAQSDNGVEVTANKEQKSGDGGDQDDQDATKDDITSESGATVYEPAVDDIENRQDGDGLTEGQSGIDDQGESAAAKG